MQHIRRGSGSSPSTPHPSPPTSPGVFSSISEMFGKLVKSHTIQYSLDEPQTHPSVAADTSGKNGPYMLTESFVCLDAVNMLTLLAATRDRLLKYAVSQGSNALVDEHWKYTICEPKNRSNGTFRVQITYTACFVHSDFPDPHKPVALDQVKGVPGCMTIRYRN